MESNFIQIIIQGGAIGLSLVLIWGWLKKDERNSKQTENFTGVLLKFNESITKVNDSMEHIRNHQDKTNQIIKENSDIIKENNRVLLLVKDYLKK